jgi:hypothetical protein
MGFTWARSGYSNSKVMARYHGVKIQVSKLQGLGRVNRIFQCFHGFGGPIPCIKPKMRHRSDPLRAQGSRERENLGSWQ